MFQLIDLGDGPNTNTGDSARLAGSKINSNFEYFDINTVKKYFSLGFAFNSGTNNAEYSLPENGESFLSLTSSGLVSVSGFNLSLVTGAVDGPYPNKLFYVLNNTGNPITLNDNDDTNAELPFLLKKGTNLLMPNNEWIVFSYSSTGLTEMFKSWSEIDDVGGLGDALALKLNIADYNDRFKGKYTSLVNLQAAHPTSNDGDYAIVDAGSGTDALEYIWDANEGWVKGNSPGAATTDALPEGSSNLYFTAARVLATVLSGISFATGGAIVSTDTVLQAFGKIQKQINDLSSVFVPLTRTLTINGTTADLSADRTFLTKAEILEWFAGDEYSVQATGSTLSNYGMSSPTTVGTASNVAANYSGGYTGNPIAFYPHRTSSTGATIGNTAEFYENTNKLVANELGFVFHGRESFTWASGCASYAGLTDSNTATGNVNPSTLLNSIIYGADDTDSNLQFMHNDGSGIATKHNMGSNFALQSNNAYYFIIWNEYGTNTVNILIRNLRNGAVYQTNVNSDLPASTVGLAPHLWVGNRATSNNCAIKFSYYKIKRQH